MIWSRDKFDHDAFQIQLKHGNKPLIVHKVVVPGVVDSSTINSFPPYVVSLAMFKGLWMAFDCKYIYHAYGWKRPITHEFKWLRPTLAICLKTVIILYWTQLRGLLRSECAVKFIFILFGETLLWKLCHNANVPHNSQNFRKAESDINLKWTPQASNEPKFIGNIV